MYPDDQPGCCRSSAATHFQPLGITLWLDEWQASCQWNLAKVAIDAVNAAELFEATGSSACHSEAILQIKMTYGMAHGSVELREAIASLYDQQSIDNVAVTHGASGANMLVHRALVDQGDHVLSIVPDYQQHYAIPTSVGANVQSLALREANCWLPDLDELRAAVLPTTKLIVFSNPNNPTGALIGEETLEEIAAIARSCGAWVLCDEVFRGIDQYGSGWTTAMADIYERGISTGSLSKIYSLAGLRVGWIAAPDLVIEDVVIHRDNDTIAVGVIDDCLAALALRNNSQVLGRTRDMLRDTLPILADWVEAEPRLSWARPRSGTAGFVRFDLPMSSCEFCAELAQQRGVLLTPGSLLGLEGYVRIGFGMDREILTEGLARISDFLATFEDAQPTTSGRG